MRTLPRVDIGRLLAAGLAEGRAGPRTGQSGSTRSGSLDQYTPRRRPMPSGRPEVQRIATFQASSPTAPHPGPPPRGGRETERPSDHGFRTPSPLVGEGRGGGEGGSTPRTLQPPCGPDRSVWTHRSAPPYNRRRPAPAGTAGAGVGDGDPIEEGARRRFASDVSGHRTAGRRDRPRAVAGRPHAGRGPAGPARLPAGRLHAGEPPGAARRRSTTRRSRRSTATRVALKHPTVTAEESPNAVLRRRLDLSVIHRPVYTIPGVPTNFRRELDLDIVRIATGGTYDDPGRLIGEDGAVSLRIVERRPVREAARYAFSLARKTGKRVTTRLEVHDPEGDRRPVRAASPRRSPRQYPEVPHNVELFDALLGKVIMAPEKFQIVLVLNEYGDFLSDMACGLAGSLGIGASANLAFDPAAVVRVALFDAAHGTAPDIAGKNLANPTAIFLALSMLLYQLGEISRRPGGQERDARPAPPGGPHPRPRRPGVDRQLHRGRRRRGRPPALKAERRGLRGCGALNGGGGRGEASLCGPQGTTAETCLTAASTLGAGGMGGAGRRSGLTTRRPLGIDDAGDRREVVADDGRDDRPAVAPVAEVAERARRGRSPRRGVWPCEGGVDRDVGQPPEPGAVEAR